MYIYESYKKARSKTWDVLAECGVSALPIDLWVIANYYEIPIYTYSNYPLLHLFQVDKKKDDGFSIKMHGVKTILINDKKGTQNRRRFTVAHELGHCLLDHPLEQILHRNNEGDGKTSILEYEANIFARDLLMPAIVLAKLGINTPQQIIELCNVSMKSAEIRCERLKELHQREEKFLKEKGYSCFGLDRRERIVLQQFKNFIAARFNKNMR